MLFMAPPDHFRRLLREAILRLSAFFPPARRRVDSGKMSEPFVYSGSPLIVPDDQPASAWKGAPPLGGKVPDTPCTLADASGPRAEFLRHLIGAGFVALYFYTGEEHQAGREGAGEGRMDGAALKGAAFRMASGLLLCAPSNLQPRWLSTRSSPSRLTPLPARSPSWSTPMGAWLASLLPNPARST